MHCPDCGEPTRYERERDTEVAFDYHVCPVCGWDDYEEQAVDALALDFNND